jgi:hypothetical protein
MKTQVMKTLPLAVPILFLFVMVGCGHKPHATPSGLTNATESQATQTIPPAGTNSSVTNLSNTNSPAATNNP